MLSIAAKGAAEKETKLMSSVNLIFPHQLFEESPLAENGYPVYLVEEFLFFRQYLFHKQKIAFHRASMKYYQHCLQLKGVKVYYVDAHDDLADVRKLIKALGKKNVGTIHYMDPCDDWLGKRIQSGVDKAGIQSVKHASSLFLNTKEELNQFFKPGKKKFFQTEFYISQRKKRKILIDEKGAPLGGKWSFDAENRKKYPKSKTPPSIQYPRPDPFYKEAKNYVDRCFPQNPGELSDTQLYPTNFVTTQKWFQDFLHTRFEEFGPYEDAIIGEQSILNHSVLTPMLNVGLITPKQIIDTTIRFIEEYDIPLNSAEGFVRQIIGWREFIRGVYESKGAEERTKNFWGFTRKIPASFYDGTTGVDPVDTTIKKVLRTGYCHHIERLMVLGNFMLLCEFDPDEVYRWFMELFIDAYDWVMVPNVYGMSQFADGGLMATKPYISGSNYLVKMSDYKKGAWQSIWDALFWRFMHVHRVFFTKNPRLGMLVRSFDRMSEERRKLLIETADDYLKSLG